MRPNKPQSKSQQDKLDVSNPHTQKLDKSSQQDELSNHLYAIWSADDMDKGEFEFRSRAIQSYIDKTVAQEANKARIQMFNRIYDTAKDIDDPVKGSERIIHELNIIREKLTAQNKNRA